MLQQCPDHRIGIFRDAEVLLGDLVRDGKTAVFRFFGRQLPEQELTAFRLVHPITCFLSELYGNCPDSELVRRGAGEVGNDTQKVLTVQLRQMEASGLLTRKVYAEVPPRVEYTLTDLGYSLKPILDAMWTWGEGYQKMMSTQPPEA